MLIPQHLLGTGTCRLRNFSLQSCALSTTLPLHLLGWPGRLADFFASHPAPALASVSLAPHGLKATEGGREVAECS